MLFVMFPFSSSCFHRSPLVIPRTWYMFPNSSSCFHVSPFISPHTWHMFVKQQGRNPIFLCSYSEAPSMDGPGKGPLFGTKSRTQKCVHFSGPEMADKSVRADCWPSLFCPPFSGPEHGPILAPSSRAKPESVRERHDSVRPSPSPAAPRRPAPRRAPRRRPRPEPLVCPPPSCAACAPGAAGGEGARGDESMPRTRADTFAGLGVQAPVRKPCASRVV